MNKDQLAALTEEERRLERAHLAGPWADEQNRIRAVLTALADARLEVTRLTEERERLLRLGVSSYRLGCYFAGLAAAIRGTWERVDRQQREDIRRLMGAVEAVCAKACLTGRSGEDGYTYQVGRDGDAALRALAAVRDEFAAKYQKGAE